MSAVGVHKITHDFELELCRYLGSPFAVAVDNGANAMALCLIRENVRGLEISIPERTYMSAPCEILLAGAKIKWLAVEGDTLTGEYNLGGTRIWDSALRFTCGMYRPGHLQCISFTGAHKHLKLGKGGAILCDNEDDYNWFKKARNSGRDECSYHCDNFNMIGKNYYMMPEIAARGLLLIQQFWTLDGKPIPQEDKTLPYPKLSRFECYQQESEEFNLRYMLRYCIDALKAQTESGMGIILRSPNASHLAEQADRMLTIAIRESKKLLK